MSEDKMQNYTANKPVQQPFRVRLPGFVGDDDMGLGDMIKRVSLAVGIRPCDGCAQRAAKLNRWLVISGRG